MHDLGPFHGRDLALFEPLNPITSRLPISAQLVVAFNARQQRPHKGDEVTQAKAKDLRPGDIWVTRKGAHVRMVMEAYESTNSKDKPVIEFTTAESASSDALGHTDKAWQTKSLETIHKIKNVAGKGSIDGQFFRVKEPCKKKSKE